MPATATRRPSNFFGITFLTEGLKRVLTSAAQRLGDTGGDPVIGLQTAFGGGKTHTMLAIFHLAQHLSEGGDPRSLAGVCGGFRQGRHRRFAEAKARRLRRFGGRPGRQPEDRKGAARSHRLGLSRVASCRR